MAIGGYTPQRVESCPMCGDDLEKYLAWHLEYDCSGNA